MKGLEKLKDKYAKDNGYKDWSDFLWCIRYAFKDKHQAITLLEEANNEVSKQAVHQALEEAAEKIEEKEILCFGTIDQQERKAFKEAKEIVQELKNNYQYIQKR